MPTAPDFGYQPEMCNARTQTTWQILLAKTYGAASRDIAQEYLHTGKGFVQALRDTELIDDTGESLMSTTLHRAWIAALDRLDGDDTEWRA